MWFLFLGLKTQNLPPLMVNKPQRVSTTTHWSIKMGLYSTHSEGIMAGADELTLVEPYKHVCTFPSGQQKYLQNRWRWWILEPLLLKTELLLDKIHFQSAMLPKWEEANTVKYLDPPPWCWGPQWQQQPTLEAEKQRNSSPDPTDATKHTHNITVDIIRVMFCFTAAVFLLEELYLQPV